LRPRFKQKLQEENDMANPPYDDRDGWIWMDGEMRPWREAKIHVLNHALHYGSCVFEGERAYNGHVFKSREHSERLINSGKILDMDIGLSAKDLCRIKAEVLTANGFTDAYVRPVAWRGSEMMAVSARQSKIHVAVAVWQWPSYFSPEAKMQGIHLKTSKWRRPAAESAPVHAKAAGLYMICTLSKHEAERAGVHDAMMLDYRGYVAEATGANIFFDMGGELHTPTADCFLNGITRRTVIDLAREQGIKVVERHIMPDEISKATECFLTGTAAEVTPVGRIDEVVYKPAEMCQSLMNAYSELVRKPPKAEAA
jgi:branched-chain amino acid aminotransferase